MFELDDDEDIGGFASRLSTALGIGGQLTEADKKSARDYGLMMAGLAMMANSRGNDFWTGVGRGGMAGLQAYQQDLQSKSASNARSVALKASLAKLYKDAEGLRRIDQDAATWMPGKTSASTQAPVGYSPPPNNPLVTTSPVPLQSVGAAAPYKAGQEVAQNDAVPQAFETQRPPGRQLRMFPPDSVPGKLLLQYPQIPEEAMFAAIRGAAAQRKSASQAVADVIKHYVKVESYGPNTTVFDPVGQRQFTTAPAPPEGAQYVGNDPSMGVQPIPGALGVHADRKATEARAAAGYNMVNVPDITGRTTQMPADRARDDAIARSAAPGMIPRINQTTGRVDWIPAQPGQTSVPGGVAAPSGAGVAPSPIEVEAAQKNVTGQMTDFNTKFKNFKETALPNLPFLYELQSAIRTPNLFGAGKPGEWESTLKTIANHYGWWRGDMGMVENTQFIAAQMGRQVLQIVTGLGSGQSISNADRIFAEKMAMGGEGLTATPQTLDRLIKIQIEATQKLHASLAADVGVLRRHPVYGQNPFLETFPDALPSYKDWLNKYRTDPGRRYNFPDDVDPTQPVPDARTGQQRRQERSLRDALTK